MLVGLLLGVALTANLATLLAVGYVLYRYAYKPWIVMRQDFKALTEALEAVRAEFKAEIGLKNARALTDEEEARMEAVMRRQAGRARFGL